MVKIVVQNRPHKGIFYYEPATSTYEGELVPVPEWVANDCIAITGDDFTPIRIIPKRDIVSGLDVDKVPEPERPQVYEVRGSKGDLYKVSFSQGNWFCNCKGFQFRSNCKHITEKKNELQARGQGSSNDSQ